MIEQLFAQLQALFPVEEVVVEEPQEVIFYIHFNIHTLQITSVSASNDVDEDHFALALGYEQGMKFMLGEENTINWEIIFEDSVYSIRKIDSTLRKVSRVEMGLGIYQVKMNDWDDVRLQIIPEENAVDIHYDGEMLKQTTAPVKMYFTREDDLAYLKCAFVLDVNILNHIVEENDLTCWPNPIRLTLDDVDDLSIYAIKGPLTVSLYEP